MIGAAAGILFHAATKFRVDANQRILLPAALLQLGIKLSQSAGQLAQGPANKIFLPYEATGILAAVAQIAEAARVDKGRPG